MPDRGWKAFERRVAAWFHQGQRIPVTGERDGADIDAAPFWVQCKLRKALSLRAARSALIRLQAKVPEGDTALLVHKFPGERDTEAVVMMLASEFKGWHGRSEVQQAQADEARPEA